MSVVGAIKTGLQKTAEVGCRGLNYLSYGYNLLGKGVQVATSKVDLAATQFFEDEAKSDIGIRAGSKFSDIVGSAYTAAVENAKRFSPKRIDKVSMAESAFGDIKPEAVMDFQKD